MQVRSLGWEDLLEKKMTTHSSYSCLGNPMDRGAWQAIVHGVAKSWTRLKQLSTGEAMPGAWLHDLAR